MAAVVVRAGEPVDFAADLARIHLEMIGGEKKIAALQAIRATGRVHVAGADLTVEMWAQRPNRVRVETIGGDVRITRGYDGVSPPWIRVGDAKTKVQSAEDGAAFVAEANFDDPFYRTAERGIALHYEGAETVDGRELSRVLTRGPNGVALYYLDEAGMIVRRDIVRVMRGEEVIEETYFSDFRPVGGVLQPHLIETRVGNNILHRTTLTNVDANPFLLDGFFSVQ